MTDNTTHNEQFTAFKVAVLIPTYNNANTLGSVLEDVLSYTSHVIVVNDGSTDHTTTVLDNFPQIQRVDYTPNRGKGIALRRGFRYALQQGYNYVITMDADGQHFASDLLVFLEKLPTHQRHIIIGARNLQQENMPGKNTFANKFSNFWFYVETGLKGPDTQSGYRLYPVYAMQGMHFMCTKYEFEIEVLVRCSWKGIKINWAPVKVYYPPADERVSHFRPFRDFSRISILNTVLVLIAFLYIKPRNFIRYLFKKDSWYSMWHDHFLNKHESNALKAASIGVGIFMGIVPIWGLQLITAVAVAAYFRLNKALVLIACNISMPPLIPFFIYGSFETGKLFVPAGTAITITDNLSIEGLKKMLSQNGLLNAVQYFAGGTTLAIALGLLGFTITWLCLKIFRPAANN
jgi:glycosyltransferase involved in cell wall biosynthesis